jgi:hypothetical protein
VRHVNHTINHSGKRYGFHLGRRGGGKAGIGLASIPTRANRMAIPNQAEFQTGLNCSMWNGTRSGPKQTSPDMSDLSCNASREQKKGTPDGWVPSLGCK